MKLYQRILFCLATMLVTPHHAAAKNACLTSTAEELCQCYGVSGLEGLYAQNLHILKLLQLKETRFAGPHNKQNQPGLELPVDPALEEKPG